MPNAILSRPFLRCLTFTLSVSLLLGCEIGAKEVTRAADSPAAVSSSPGDQLTLVPDRAQGNAKPAADAAFRIKASNTAVLRKRIGQDVVVYGRVNHTAKAKGGNQFLNFYGAELAVICLASDVSNFKRGSPADVYKQQDIEVRGRLELYKNKLQIKLRDPKQIRLDAATGSLGAGQNTQSKPLALQQLEKDVWLSPAGLRYKGRDPRGETRLEHVLRHARNQPNRIGKHGVFDGGRDGALAVIDEAWKLAKKRKLRARREGDRSTYTVNMGRRIGYLGGQEGRRRGNPPLRRIFIVFESGTTNIVTAFPK